MQPFYHFFFGHGLCHFYEIKYVKTLYYPKEKPSAATSPSIYICLIPFGNCPSVSSLPFWAVIFSLPALQRGAQSDRCNSGRSLSWVGRLRGPGPSQRYWLERGCGAAASSSWSYLFLIQDMDVLIWALIRLWTEHGPRRQYRPRGAAGWVRF